MTLPDDIELREKLAKLEVYTTVKSEKHPLYYKDIEAILEFIATYRKKWETDAADKVAKNALVIADYWINEDGRSKHLLQDLQDVKDISVLDHIDQKYIDRYKEKTSD